MKKSDLAKFIQQWEQRKTQRSRTSSDSQFMNALIDILDTCPDDERLPKGTIIQLYKLTTRFSQEDKTLTDLPKRILNSIAEKISYAVEQIQQDLQEAPELRKEMSEMASRLSLLHQQTVNAANLAMSQYKVTADILNKMYPMVLNHVNEALTYLQKVKTALKKNTASGFFHFFSPPPVLKEEQLDTLITLMENFIARKDTPGKTMEFHLDKLHQPEGQQELLSIYQSSIDSLKENYANLQDILTTLADSPLISDENKHVVFNEINAASEIYPGLIAAYETPYRNLATTMIKSMFEEFIKNTKDSFAQLSYTSNLQPEIIEIIGLQQLTQSLPEKMEYSTEELTEFHSALVEKISTIESIINNGSITESVCKNTLEQCKDRLQSLSQLLEDTLPVLKPGAPTARAPDKSRDVSP